MGMRRGLSLLTGLALSATSFPAGACSDPIRNKVTVSRQNGTLWNGVQVDRLLLIRYLVISETMNPLPQLHFDYENGANCGVVRNVARTIALTAKVAVSVLDRPRGPCRVPAKYAATAVSCFDSVGTWFLRLPGWMDEFKRTK